MYIPVAFTFIGIALIIFTVYIKTRKSGDLQLDAYNEFLDKEQEANFSRRKDPVPEDYLTVDVNKLPIREYPDDQAYQRVLLRQLNALTFAQMPMIYGYRGMNNRELKLKYGAANLDMIITYEENYDQFIHNLLEWATALISLGNLDDAAAVLEVAAEYNCDRSQAYTLLADIYSKRGELAKLDGLKSRALEVLPESAVTRALAHIDGLMSAGDN